MNIYHKYSSAVFPRPEVTFWDNPEQFLQRCNSSIAVPDAPLSKELKRIAKKEVNFIQTDMGEIIGEKCLEQLAKAAKLELALEVSIFLEGANLRSEQWIGHRDWMECLNSMDVIATFNYDDALERLARTFGKAALVRTVIENGTRHSTETPIYKLHGSITWKYKNSQFVEECSLPDILSDLEADVGIFAPGPEKFNQALDDIRWRTVMRRISEASDVYLIGYRFPETDLLALQMIGRALSGLGSDHRVHIVLGEGENAPHVRRCKEFVRAMNGGVDVRVYPFGCSEFFLAYSNAKLTI